MSRHLARLLCRALDHDWFEGHTVRACKRCGLIQKRAVVPVRVARR